MELWILKILNLITFFSGFIIIYKKGKNESQILQKLFPHQQDSITRLRGFTNDSTKLIMEYYFKGTLFDVTNLKAFPENIAKSLMIQLAKVVYYLHTEITNIHGDIKPPIIHGDIKLQSILMSTQCNIKLCNLGFAQENQEQNQEQNQLLGQSVGDSAPEIHNPPNSAKNDILALAIVFFQLLTGSPPLNTNKPNEFVTDQYRNILNKQDYKKILDSIQLESGLLVSNNFKILIEGMLHPVSQQRWSIEQVIKSDYLQENDSVADENEVIIELKRRVKLINQENQ